MNEKILRDLLSSLKTAGKPKTSAYDTTATVTRVEGGIAWVHIPGGVTETPVKLTINAKAGDTVQVRVSGGRAFMVGNASAPPTDDTVAVGAVRQISAVRKVVEKVREVAETASRIAGNTNQYFWHTQEGTDTGAHITEIPQEDFLADPANGGGNLLARSNGIAVRDGLDELAVFASDNIQLRDKIGRDLFVVGVDEDEDSVSYSKASGSVTQTSIKLTPLPKSGTTIYFYYAYTRNGVEYNGSTTFAEGTSNSQTTQYVSLDYTVNSGGQRVTVSPRSVQSCRAVSVKYVIQANGIRFTLGWRDATKTAGPYSSVIGINCSASGSGAVATNSGTTASGAYSHATGEDTTASGRDAFSANRNTEAVGEYSFATGFYSRATGSASEAHGRVTQAFSDNQAVFGKYNEPDNNDEYAVIIGNGADNINRSNAFTVDWNGNMVASGKLTASAVQSYTPTWESGHAPADYHCVVSAGICSFSYRGPAIAHSDSTQIGTLPVGARPTSAVYCSFVKMGGGAVGCIRIQTTGVITVLLITDTSSTGRLYFNCSFPVV